LAKDTAEKVVKDIRRATRKQYSAEEKNRIPDDVRARVITLALNEPELSPRELAVRFTARCIGAYGPSAAGRVRRERPRRSGQCRATDGVGSVARTVSSIAAAFWSEGLARHRAALDVPPVFSTSSYLVLSFLSAAQTWTAAFSAPI
jgi:hypothetical protein